MTQTKFELYNKNHSFTIPIFLSQINLLIAEVRKPYYLIMVT
jgi:hypothetical protein